MSNSARLSIDWSRMLEPLQRFGAFATVLAIAAFGFLGGHFLLPGTDHADVDSHQENTKSAAESDSVTLTSEKLAAAKLATRVVTRESFQPRKVVPGIITYDATKRIELRATIDCVVQKTLVQQLESVQRGQPLLRLTGPAIGAARSEISQSQANVALLEKEYSWTLETHTNLKALLAFLDQSPTYDQVKTRFETRSLGEHRNEILSAYAELALAKQLSSRMDRLKSQGAIAGKEVDERKNRLDVATAKFTSIREEMTFQVSQQLARAKANLEHGKKQLEICRDKLQSLLGSPSHPTKSAGADVTEFVLASPRAGRVVSLPAVEASRFEPGEVMVEVADLSDVWVEAQVSQRDWHDCVVEPGQPLTVRVPALPQYDFIANVKHIGASVSRSTMAIPVVAQLSNSDNRFRPGMSIWVEIPTGGERQSIVVAEGAVQRNERNTFVFVQLDPQTFVRRDVELGDQFDGRVEIMSGVAEGETVVVEGAFLLKSELLLAEEE